MSVTSRWEWGVQPAFQSDLRFAGSRALQVGVGEGGVFLGHGAETLDGIHQVLLIHVLQKEPVIH